LYLVFRRLKGGGKISGSIVPGLESSRKMSPIMTTLRCHSPNAALLVSYICVYPCLGQNIMEKDSYITWSSVVVHM